MYKTIYWFGAGHLHNKYIGVDGGSNIRLPLMRELMEFGYKIYWMGFSANKRFKNSYMDLMDIYEYSGVVDLTQEVEYTNQIKEDGALLVEFRPNIQKPGYNFEFEWKEQINLINEFLRRNLPVFVWDQDHWAAEQLDKDLLQKIVLLTPSEKRIEGSIQETFYYPTTNEKVNLNFYGRDIDIVYCGNVYGRRDDFGEFMKHFNSDNVRVLVTGNWLRKDNGDRDFALDNFNHFMWIGQTEHWTTIPLLRRALFTVQINNKAQQEYGQPTARLFEAHRAGCLPITNANVKGIENFVPYQLLAKNGDEAFKIYTRLKDNLEEYAHVWNLFNERMLDHTVNKKARQLTEYINRYSKVLSSK